MTERVETVKSEKLNGEPEFSFSQLNDYDTCGEKYRLRRVERMPEMALGAGIAGKAVHSTIQAAEDGGWWRGSSRPEIAASNELLREAFLERFLDALKAETQPIVWTGKKSDKWPLGENRAWWEQNGPAMLRRFAQLRRDDEHFGLRLQAGGSEMHVRARAAGHLVQGYIDAALLVTADGEQVVRDYKTGSQLSLKRLQLVMYAYLLSETVGKTVTYGEFVWLRGVKPETMLKRYNIAGQVPLVPKLIDDHARSIEAGVFRLNPSNLCKTCTVKSYCPWGSTLEDEE